MKKIITFIIIATLTLSCLMNINVGAEETFGKAEAEALLIEAYQRYMLTQIYETYSEYPYLKDDYIGKEYAGKKIPLSASGEWEYALSSKGIPYKSGSPLFTPVQDPRFDTMEKCYSYMGEVFTEDWAKLIIDVHRHSSPQNIRETFRTSKGGLICYYDPEEKPPVVPFEQDPNWMHIKVVYNYGETGTGDMWRRLKSIGDFHLNGDTATLDVVFACVNPENALQWEYHDKEVTFENTSAGWRVSGGSFFEAMHLYNFNGQNPLDPEYTPVESTPAETVPETVPETSPETTPETIPETIPITQAPATQAPATQAPTAQTPAEQRSGCGSVIGGGFAVIAIVSLAGVAFKKKQ